MFSIRLKELRQKHNLSQREFAEILKVSTGTVGNWEVGMREPDFKTLIKIANFFNVSCDYLLDRFSTDDEDENKIRVSISDTEQELLSQFRIINKKFGSVGQEAIITITKVMNNTVK